MRPKRFGARLKASTRLKKQKLEESDTDTAGEEGEENKAAGSDTDFAEEVEKEERDQDVKDQNNEVNISKEGESNNPISPPTHLQCSLCSLRISGPRQTGIDHVVSRHRNTLRNLFAFCSVDDVVKDRSSLSREEREFVLAKEQLREATTKAKEYVKMECRACGFRTKEGNIFRKHLLDHSDSKLETLAARFVKPLEEDQKEGESRTGSNNNVEKAVEFLQAKVGDLQRKMIAVDSLETILPTGLLVRVERGGGGGGTDVKNEQDVHVSDGQNMSTSSGCENASSLRPALKEPESATDAEPIFILRCQNREEKKRGIPVPSYEGKLPKVYHRGEVQDVLSHTDVLSMHSYSKAIFLASRRTEPKEGFVNGEQQARQEEEKESRSLRGWKSMRQPAETALSKLFDSRPYQCKICLESLTASTSKKHVLDSHLCGKDVDIVFEDDGGMTLSTTVAPRSEASIVRWTFGSQEKELFSCNFCQDCIRLDRDEVRSHVMARHLGLLDAEERFYCHKCTFAGKSKASWENHNKMCGKIRSMGIQTAGYTHEDKPYLAYNCQAVNLVRTRGVSAKVCRICKEEFKTFSGVLPHLTEDHNFVKKGIACRKCDRKCHHEREMRQHWQAAHADLEQQATNDATDGGQETSYSVQVGPGAAVSYSVQVCWVCGMQLLTTERPLTKDRLLCRSQTCKATAVEWRQALIVPAKKVTPTPPLPPPTFLQQNLPVSYTAQELVRYTFPTQPLPYAGNIHLRPTQPLPFLPKIRMPELDPWQNSKCSMCDYLPLSVDDMVAHWQKHNNNDNNTSKAADVPLLVNVESDVKQEEEEDYSCEFDPLQITADDDEVGGIGLDVEDDEVMKDEEIEEEIGECEDDDIAEEVDNLEEDVKLDVQNCC